MRGLHTIRLRPPACVSTASLGIVEGVGRGTRYQIGRQRVGIGRSSQNTVRILDEEASRFHAAIQWESHGFVLVDLDSANGTLLNGVREQQAPLAEGDELRMGKLVLRIVVREGAGDVN